VKKIKIGEYLVLYKQERGCLVQFVRLANTLLKDEESARDTTFFACNFARYSPLLIFFSDKLSNKPALTTPPPAALTTLLDSV